MYYLQSRYYDPAIGRFINADTFATTDADGFLSCNMFAYCGNNPVNQIDKDGETGVFIAANFVIGAVVGAVGQITTNLLTGSNWYDGVLGAAIGGGVYNTVALVAKNTATNSVWLSNTGH